MNPLKIITGEGYRSGQSVVIWASASELAHKAMANRLSVDAHGGFVFYRTDPDHLDAFGESESLGTKITAEDKAFIKGMKPEQFKLYKLCPNMLNCREDVHFLASFTDTKDFSERFLEFITDDTGEPVQVTDAEDFREKLKFLLAEANNPENEYTRRCDGW